MRTLFLTLITCLFVLPAYAKYSGGTGEPNDPYQIATAEDLIALGETPEDYGKHFILTADIDLDPNLPGRKVFDKAVIAPGDVACRTESCRFTGISFVGVFDGNDRTISHLTVTGAGCLGLFGWLASGAEVRDLGLADVNITGSRGCIGGLAGGNQQGTVTGCHCTGSVTGGWNVGGLVGDNECGTVTSCYNTGRVSGTDHVGGLLGENGDGAVTRCYSMGSVSGVRCVGGLVGINGTASAFGCHDRQGGPVTECYSTGEVSGTWDRIGGLVGANDSDVTYCYSTAAVSGHSHVGGLIGSNGSDDQGAVIRCASTGTVRGAGQNIGGLVGSNTNVVLQSFWDVETSGQASSAGGTGKTTAEMQDPNTFMADDWDFVGPSDGPHDIWAEPAGGGYPILWWQLSPWPELLRFSGGSGEPNDPYLISTAEQLNSIGHNPRLMTRHFRLDQDLDLTGVRFHPIGWSYELTMSYPYRAVFDGNGHTISHLTVKGGNNVGLFGQLASGAEIKDLGVMDVNISDSTYHVGGLVGSNGSWYSPGGNVTRCYSTGSVSADTAVGGLVGYNWGTVTCCHSACTVHCASPFGGGLVGWHEGALTNCYSAGALSGNDSGGGLMGVNWGSVTACFWDTETSGQPKSAGGTGKTTAEMQTAKTFLDAGWDFVGETANGTEDIWWILEGKDYPRLWWELPPEN